MKTNTNTIIIALWLKTQHQLETIQLKLWEEMATTQQQTMARVQRKKDGTTERRTKGKGIKNKQQGPPFEGLWKEDDFKGVAIECGKPAIQSQNLCLACKTHANTKNQPLVADSIKFREPICSTQFFNAVIDPVNYMVMKSDNISLEENACKKKTEESRVDYQIRFQTQKYQKALTFVQTLWNIAFGQCSESFQLALIKKGTDCGE